MTGKERFINACRKEAVDCTPVWLMRQAGRYMPEYRILRQKYSLLTLCKTPELAAEVTMQPIERFELDAAIIFADILLPIEPMGLKLEFASGEGPVIENPVTSEKDVDRIVITNVEGALGFVAEALRIVSRKLADKTALIGFAGAPFTLASYMIEGGYSRNFLKTKQFMFHKPDAWHGLMDKIATTTRSYLQMQVKAGAMAVQLFDSWVGTLSPAHYENFVLPYSHKVLEGLTVPVIHFSTGTTSYLPLIAKAGGDVISVDWRINLDEAWSQIPDKAIQGNLDPASLLKRQAPLISEIREILKQAKGRPGHIFNLGHGVFPETPVENVALLVEEVHGFNIKNQISNIK